MSYKITPLFIPSTIGDLFALYYVPQVEHKKKCIIHIPAFAEEMNKSRRMVAMQSRAFVEQGYSVLVLDLFGTGDSQGNFAEATWTSWLQSIEVGIEWLESQGVEIISLWGLRSGVLLALDFLQQYDYQIDQLICWQPVLNAETFIMQFLRLRIAAAMMDKNAPQEKTSDLKRQLLEGQCVEVAGYMLNPELVSSMIVLKARKMEAPQVNRCVIFELTADNEATVSHASAQWLESLQQQNIDVTLDMIQGSSFWATQEIAMVPELINITVANV